MPPAKSWKRYETAAAYDTARRRPTLRVNVSIHPSAWNRNSRKFAGTEFSEVRNAKQHSSNRKDTRFGGYADAPAPGHLRGYIGTGRGLHTFLPPPPKERVVLMRRIMLLH